MGTSEKWSEGGEGKELCNKKWSRREGDKGKETLASKDRYFEKPHSPANGEISASDWCGI